MYRQKKMHTIALPKLPNDSRELGIIMAEPRKNFYVLFVDCAIIFFPGVRDHSINTDRRMSTNSERQQYKRENLKVDTLNYKIS